MQALQYVKPGFLLLFQGLFTIQQVAPEERVRMCYYTNWSQWRQGAIARLLPSDMDPFLCTHILYAYAKVDPALNTVQTVESNDVDMYRDLVDLKNTNPDLKVLLVVGARNLVQPFITIARDNTSIDTFAQNTIGWLRQNRLDGLELAWQWPDLGSRELYHTFVQRVRAALDEETERTHNTRLLLAISVSADNTVGIRYQPLALTPYVDYILLSTFELFYITSTRLSHHSPLYVYHPDPRVSESELYSLNKTVQAWVDGGAPRRKLVAGFATFGIPVRLVSADQHSIGDTFLSGTQATAGKYTRSPSFWAYYEICEYLSAGWTVERVPNSTLPYAYNTSSMDWVSYDDQLSFRSKAEYVVDQGLAGAMVWTVAMDDFSALGCNNGTYPLINNIKQVFDAAGPLTTVSTTTSTTSSTTATTHSSSTPSVVEPVQPRILPPDPGPGNSSFTTTSDMPAKETTEEQPSAEGSYQSASANTFPLVPVVAGVVGGIVFVAICFAVINSVLARRRRKKYHPKERVQKQGTPLADSPSPNSPGTPEKQEANEPSETPHQEPSAPIAEAEGEPEHVYDLIESKKDEHVYDTLQTVDETKEQPSIVEEQVKNE